MLISALPPDGIRYILRFLDYASLVNLNATFNRSIQRSLSAPNTFSVLRFEAVDELITGLSHYFIRSVRDVYRLELSGTSSWSPDSYTLLRTLNPVELVLERGFASGAQIQAMDDFSNNPTDTRLGELAKTMTKNGFPDLRVLTPRLKSLSFDQNFNLAYATPYGRDRYFRLLLRDRVIREIQMPPTVTSVHGRRVSFSTPEDREALEHFPTSIQRLHYEFPHTTADRQPFKDLLIRYRHLSYLRVEGAAVYLNPTDVGVPKCLEELDIRNSQFFPQALLEHSSIKESALHSLTLHVPINAEPVRQPSLLEVNFALLLPTTLTSLSLALNDESLRKTPGAVTLSNLPSTLVNLSVDLSVSVPSIFDSVEKLNRLKTLKIRAKETLAFEVVLIPLKKSSPDAHERGVTPLVLGHLSASLEVFSMSTTYEHVFTAEELQSLPTGLTELYVDYACANYKEVLLQRSPACRIFFYGDQ